MTISRIRISQVSIVMIALAKQNGTASGSYERLSPDFGSRVYRNGRSRNRRLLEAPLWRGDSSAHHCLDRRVLCRALSANVELTERHRSSFPLLAFERRAKAR